MTGRSFIHCLAGGALAPSVAGAARNQDLSVSIRGREHFPHDRNGFFRALRDDMDWMETSQATSASVPRPPTVRRSTPESSLR